MGMFGTPMDEPWSAKRKISLLLYLIFLTASAWASGQSLGRTLHASPATQVFCYILALAALATASFSLNLVKMSVGRGYVSGRPVKLIFGVVGFAILWFLILMANTHNIYYVMTINNQRQRELSELKNQMELVETKSISAFSQAKDKFRTIVEGDIRNMKDEIQNPNNPGSGPETGKIINRIEKNLGQAVDRPSNLPDTADFYVRRQYAETMANKIREMTANKLSSVDDQISQLRKFLQNDDYLNARRAVSDLIDRFDTRTDAELTQGLRNGYSMYDKLQQYVRNLYSLPLIKENAELALQPLPAVPVSIESTDIAYVWGEYLKGGNISLPRFRWAIFIALILDLSCFLFWYFGVLPEEA